jgi:uncharacterized repeat protein (TIGR01451 family)
MRTLMDVFAPDTPALPEGLRTLQVSPSRFVEPGETVHAQFTFRNLGGGTATGFRVRFRLPEGLTYLVGTARVDETPLDEQGGLTTLLQGSGADIGDIPPGGERRVSLDYTVATTIENGTPIALQAAIASFEVPVIGSNVVRLVVRSRPLLQNGKTKLFVTPVREAVPGEELQIRALVHNAGESSAHDVMVLLPVPANTSYVEGSARVDGRPLSEGVETDPFGLSRPRIVAPMLAPGATLEVTYRTRIEPILEDETRIEARGAICSQELAEFSLQPIALTIPSLPSFENDETSFDTDCDDEVVPGQRVRLAVRVRNSGTARAHNVRVKIAFPGGLLYCSGSRTVDGGPAADRKEKESGLFTLGELEPRRTVEVALSAIVRSPLANGTELPISARIDWSKGNRTFNRSLTVRSAPAFPSACNYVRREGPRRLSAGEPAVFTIVLTNAGTDVATDARLHIEADNGLEHLRAYEDDAEIALGDDRTINLDSLVPAVSRTLRIESRLAEVLADESQLRLDASLRTAQLAPVDLGGAVHVATSRPRFSTATSGLGLDGAEVVRPNRVTACRLTLCNEGTDRARDVRVRLQMPDDVVIDRVDGAGRDGSVIVVGDVAARQTREVAVFLRIVGNVHHGDKLDIAARVTGHNVVPLSLEPLVLATRAEATFAHGATLTSIPAENVDAGEAIVYTLWLRNSGDGVAKRLNIRLETPSNATYAPGSTSVNGVSLLDFAGTSALLAPTGLTLADVSVGAEIAIRVQLIVNAPLPAGTLIDLRATIAWDDHPEMVVRAEPVLVRSRPALPVVDPVLPFTVVDAAAAPGQVVVRVNGHAVGVLETSKDDEALPAAERVQLPSGAAQTVDEPTIVSLHLTNERLTWIVRYLEEGRFGGLVPHLMLLRALFPDDASGAHASVRKRLRAYAEAFNELVDRLFIKLRLKDAEVAPDDIETQAIRDSLRDVIVALLSLPRPAPYEATGLRLTGAVRADDLAGAATALSDMPLVTAAPWLTLTLLLGSSLERDGKTIADLGAYREALRRKLAQIYDLGPADFLAAVLRAPIDDELESKRLEVLNALSSQLAATR